MDTRVQYDEANNVYSLGAEIEGAFIPFAQVDGDKVRGHIATAREVAAAESGQPAATGTANATLAVASVNPADYTDNGDGSYTRTTDGTQGRFTPAGFVPSEAT